MVCMCVCGVCVWCLCVCVCWPDSENMQFFLTELTNTLITDLQPLRDQQTFNSQHSSHHFIYTIIGLVHIFY